MQTATPGAKAYKLIIKGTSSLHGRKSTAADPRSNEKFDGFVIEGITGF